MADVDVCVVVIYHHNATICCVKMHVLELVACLRSLVCWFYVLLRLLLDLVTKVPAMVDAVHHCSGRFNLLLI